MDNVSSHQKPAIPRAIRSAGAQLFYLPSDSPDLNPIEQAFAKLKTLLRKANARTNELLEAAIGQILKRLTAAECRNFFAQVGYAFQQFGALNDYPPYQTRFFLRKSLAAAMEAPASSATR
jgi:hypothetical protein